MMADLAETDQLPLLVVALPTTFYAGDAWGSFNSIMRLLTGIFFGTGIVWSGFPYLEDAFGNPATFNS
jgi:hypothetical protein